VQTTIKAMRRLLNQFSIYFCVPAEQAQIASGKLVYSQSEHRTAIFSKIASTAQPIAFVEQVTGYRPGRRQPGSHMFTFGRNYEFILGTLQTLGFRIELVRPQSWRKALGLGTSGNLKPKDWTNKLKTKAQQLCPHCKVTLKTTDALLIREYAKRAAKD
jgi:hypothetical protein